MKRTLLTIAAVAGIFAVGVWCRTLITDAHSSGGGGSQPLLDAKRKIHGLPAASGTASTEKASRNFVAGRPFAKGHAKVWLLTRAADLSRSGGDMQTEMTELTQVLLTMDEESAAETTEALKELFALYNRSDPSLKDITGFDAFAKQALLQVSFRLSQLNPEAAIRMLGNYPGDTAPAQAFLFAFSHMARKDLARAESMLESIPGNRRGEALDGILGVLGGKDPPGAIALAVRYTGEINESTLTGLLHRAMKEAPRESIAEAVKLYGTKGGYPLFRKALDDWRGLDRPAAIAWAESYTGPKQNSMRAWLLENTARSDSLAAVREFNKLQPAGEDGEDFKESAKVIGWNLLKNNFAGAKDLVVNTPSGLIRDAVKYGVAGQWIKEDVTGASAWIATRPAGDERDYLSDMLVTSIAGSDPAAAFEWASDIQERGRRTSALRLVLTKWKEIDPGAFREAVAKLPEDVRNDLPDSKFKLP